MSEISKSPKWTKPNEVMQLHRLRQKKKALQERMLHPTRSSVTCSEEKQEQCLDFSRILGNTKRRNPFIKDYEEKLTKKSKEHNINEAILSESLDRTLFHLLHPTNVNQNITKEFSQATTDKLSTFTNLLQKYSSKANASDVPTQHGFDYVPIDWSLKTKVRFMSQKPFAWNHQLKASEEASGITGFVRCLDTSDSNTLDTSYRARFHQHSLYWQHPNMPWIDLFPRSNGRVSASNFIATNERIKDALHGEWTESFRSLFQLVRTRQCPYFYVCANTFTCLFRAAGICSITETCAMLSPTTRGFRQTLKQGDIEFTMPLRKRRSNEFNTSEKSKTSSLDESEDQPIEGDSPPEEQNENDKNESGDEDDLESEQFLQSLGVGKEEIKKINYSQTKVDQAKESKIDNIDESLIFIKGVDVNGLFNFLLNCKSCTVPTGPFGGIPPTLLAPTAFQGGTLKSLMMRNSEVVVENKKYYSIELGGPVLPINVHNLCSLFESNSNSFSVTFANFAPTMVFSKVAQEISEGVSKDTTMNKNPSAFYMENLSDSGMNKSVLNNFCSSNCEMVKCLDSLKYCCETKTYMYL